PMQGQPFMGGGMPMQGQPFMGGGMPMQGQPFMGGQMPMHGQPFVGGQMPMQGQPFMGGQMPMHGQPFVGGQMPYQAQPYGYGQMPMPPFGRQDQSMSKSDESEFGTTDQTGMQQLQQMGQMPYQAQPGGTAPFIQQGQHMPYPTGTQFQVMPQGPGTMMESSDIVGMPYQGSGMGMPYQAPVMSQPFHAPHMAPGNMNYDSGHGGPKMQPKPPINPFGQGTPGIYSPPFNPQMGQPPLMNPYGYGSTVDSNRGFDESSEFY
ncbi:hypothetical protein ACX9YW_02560, partial [Pseudoneobacillus sp. C159]